MKTGMANHAVFKKMLEEAEREYGFSNDGPVLLPCHVDVFYEALSEMEKERSGLLCGSFSFLTRPSHGSKSRYRSPTRTVSRRIGRGVSIAYRPIRKIK